MPAQSSDACKSALIWALYPIAEQAARIVAFFSRAPASIADSDSQLAARVSQVSAEHVAAVRRALIENGLVQNSGFSATLKASSAALERLAANLEGVATYLLMHNDRDDVRLVITE